MKISLPMMIVLCISIQIQGIPAHLEAEAAGPAAARGPQQPAPAPPAPVAQPAPAAVVPPSQPQNLFQVCDTPFQLESVTNISRY
jgi:UV excision repair protein RAD23